MVRKYLFVALLLCNCRLAQADFILVQDAFNTNGALLGTSPQVGGPWTITGTSVANPMNVAGGSLALTNNGQDAYSAFSTSISTQSGGNILSQMRINVSAANATGDYFYHLSDPAGTTNNFYQRLFVRSSGAGFQIGLASNSGAGSLTTYGVDVLSFNQNYQVGVQWNFIAGAANDTMAVTVDNNSYLAGYTWTGNAEPGATVSAANFRQGTAANAPTLTVDDLVITAVPEPNSLILLSMIALPVALVAYRRSKMNARAVLHSDA